MLKHFGAEREAAIEERLRFALGNRAESAGFNFERHVDKVVVIVNRLMIVLKFTIRGGTIVEMDAVTDPERLREIDLAVLD